MTITIMEFNYNFIAILICFIGATLFGFLSYASKHVWKDKSKTQLYALIAIAFTIAFMIIVISILP